MRIYAAVGSLLGWFALALQLYLMLVQAPGPERLEAVITYFSFFTILTNILTAVVFTAVALQPKAGMGAVVPPAVCTGRHGCLHCHCRNGLPAIAPATMESTGSPVGC
jgi:hypothetical protein